MGRDLDLDSLLRQGERGKLRQWLESRLYRWGQCLYPQELLQEVLGQELSAQPFIDYLEAKYAPLYNL